jgi:2-dehydro-3-deoxyglucarate aldolase
VKNSLKAALKAGRPVLGSWIQCGNVGIAEAMARAGFDWLAIDLEHSTISLETAEHLIRVVELCGCVPLVRLPSHDFVLAKRAMDAGAHGIIVPSVNTAEEARAAVQCIQYPPRGFRGMGLGRAHGYGTQFESYLKEVQDHGVVVAMIEHKNGVENLEKILSVPGIDAIFVGPYDLSASYGTPGALSEPAVKSALQQIIKVAAKARVACGIHVVHPPVEQVRTRLEEGFRFIAYAGDMLLLTPAANQAVSSLRQMALGKT